MNTVVLLSGGIDSASCVAFYRNLGHSVTGIFIDYGQPVREREEESAIAISSHYKIALTTIRCIGPPIDYAGEIKGRNAFLVCTCLLFRSMQCGIVALGIHHGTGYYDCSESFAADLDRIITGYTNGQASLGVPFLSWDKGMIYRFALDSGVPVDLTWSCEVGPRTPCGHCLSCRDREGLHVRT